MKNYYNEPTFTYYCKHCDKEFNCKSFSSHLKTHNIIFLDYVRDNLELFSNYHLCPICEVNVCKNTNGKRLNTCSMACKAAQQSILTKGRIGWSRGLTKDDHPGLLSMAIKASIRNKGQSPLRFWSEETKEISRKKLSDNAKIRMKGENNPMFGKTHPPNTIQKIFKYRIMNSIEQIIADFLDETGIKYYFQFFINDDSTHSYDFKIKGIPLIIEVDGDYWHGGPGCKKHFYKVDECKETDLLKTRIAEEHGFKLIRFWQSDIETNFDKIKLKILTEIDNIKI